MTQTQLEIDSVLSAINRATNPSESFYKINDTSDPRQLREWLSRFNSHYERLPALISVMGYYYMNEETIHEVLRDEWSGFDSITRYKREVRELLLGMDDPSQFDGPIVNMMTDDELKAFEALPDMLTVYRGCGPKNKAGISWTLDRSIAEKFLTHILYRVDEPLLITARVRKNKVLALKLDRDEQEIITFSARRTSVTALSIEKAVA